MPRDTPHQVILLQVEAPAKPALGAPCNGCGVCCAAEPCPLGVLLSRRRLGTCVALEWDAPQRRYVCGVLARPKAHVPFWPAAWTRRLAARWIAAGRGCDATLTPA